MYVFIDMSRDETVSRVAKTTSGRLSLDSGFLGPLVTYVLPTLGILPAQLSGTLPLGAGTDPAGGEVSRSLRLGVQNPNPDGPMSDTTFHTTRLRADSTDSKPEPGLHRTSSPGSPSRGSKKLAGRNAPQVSECRAVNRNGDVLSNASLRLL